MLAFYMDHQVRGQITRGLRQRGIDLITAFENGRSELDDDALIDRATALGRIFVSQDQDVLRIGRRRQRAGENFIGIAFIELEHIDIGKVVEYLELVAHVMPADEMRNHVEYVPCR
jgi:predicted nuclease of predicted toxin-antitoxin system